MEKTHSEKNCANTFRFTWWYSALTMFFSFIFIILFSLPILIFTPLIFSHYGANDLSSLAMFGILCLFVPYTLFALFIITFYMATSISQFFAYVRTSPEGIEYNFWPYANIRGQWQDVDKINSTVITGKILLLNKFEKLGLSISYLDFFNKLRGTKQVMIPIKDSLRNKETTISNEIMRYAPHLFEQKKQESDSNILQQENQKEMEIEQSKPNLFLVFFSHSSIMFGWIGIFIPIVILIIQSGKPGQEKNQTLQALVWQLFAIIAKGFLFFVLTIGLTLIITFLADAQLITDVTIFVILIVVFLFIAVSAIYFLFIIFPIIGIVKIAQGKEFQYPIVGRIIRK